MSIGFSEPAYWERIYTKGGALDGRQEDAEHEWYLSALQLAPLLLPLLPLPGDGGGGAGRGRSAVDALEIGCGRWPPMMTAR